MLHTASGAGDKDRRGPGLTLPTSQRERPLKSTAGSLTEERASPRGQLEKRPAAQGTREEERGSERLSQGHTAGLATASPRKADACLPPDAHGATGLTDELHLSPRQGFAQHLPDRSRDSGPLEDQSHIPFFIFPQGLTPGSEHSIEPEIESQWRSQRSTDLLKIT